MGSIKRKLKSREGFNPASVLRQDGYGDFGELGPTFQSNFEERWAIAEAEWIKLQKEEPELRSTKSFLDAFSEQISFSAYVYTLFYWQRFEGNLTLANQEVLQHSINWNSYVVPALAWPTPSSGELNLPASFRRRRHLIRCYSEAVRKLKTLPECYGKFSRIEMAYALEHHPRIVDGACGSGYFIKEFNRRGGNAIGFDNATYPFLRSPKQFPWMNELIADKLLRVCEVAEVPEEDFRDRTLLISWPVATSPYAAEILERYTNLGGRSFLLKPGGLASASTNDEADAFFRLFRVISKHWRQLSPPEAPPYRPMHVENNLLVFSRKV